MLATLPDAVRSATALPAARFILFHSATIWVSRCCATLIITNASRHCLALATKGATEMAAEHGGWRRAAETAMSAKRDEHSDKFKSSGMLWYGPRYYWSAALRPK